LDFLGNLPVEGGKLAFALFPCGKLRFPSFFICAIAVPLDEVLRWFDHVVAHGKLPRQSRQARFLSQQDLVFMKPNAPRI
jgi:hypothetical protein